MPRPLVPTQPADVGISPERLHGLVAELCAFGRKLPGSPAADQACRVLTDRLTDLGIAHRVHAFDAFISWPERTSLTLLGTQAHDIPATGVGFSASTPPEGVTAPLAAGADVAGRFVLVDGLPRYEACMSAARAGALGIIAMSSGPQRHYTQASPIWGAPAGPADLALLPPVPALQVSRADGERLRALAAAGEARLRLVADTPREWRPVRMPVADIPGREPYFVLLGAHYCTWRDGATDNLAGVALLMELARLFARGPRPRFGLRFAWWTGHEQGGYAGSSWYADHCWQELHERAIAYLNVDIVGVEGGTVKALRNVTGELAGYAGAVLEATVGPLPPEEDAFVRRALKRQDAHVDPRRSARNSDQSFCGIGLSGAQVSSFPPAASPDHLPGSGLPWWWQTDEDTAERCDGQVLATDTLIYRNLLSGLVETDALPFDYATTADDILASLEEYAEAAPDLDALGHLTRLAHRLKAAAAGLDRRDTARVLAVARWLNPVLHHAKSAYDYDLGRASRLLPGLAPALTLQRLAPDDARMARVGLKRQANRIAHALTEAIRLLEGGTRQATHETMEARHAAT